MRVETNDQWREMEVKIHDATHFSQGFSSERQI